MNDTLQIHVSAEDNDPRQTSATREAIDRAEVDTHEGGGHRFTSTGNAQVATAVGALQTVTDPLGGRLHGPVTENCRVTVQGCEMTVAQAVNHGFIEQTAEGRFVEPAVTPYDQRKARERVEELEARHSAEQAATDLTVDPETATTVNDWAAAIKGQGGNVAAVIGQALRNPDRLPGTLKVVSDAHGVDQGDVLATQQQLVRDIEQGIAGFAQDRGVDPAGFWHWMGQTQDPHRSNAAVVESIVTGHSALLHELVRQYATEVRLSQR